ncbi:MAG: hypothetical protein ACSHXY_12105 [Alphaproteobacteria bacterium]
MTEIAPNKLAQTARALLRYVVGENPDERVLDRYVLALVKTGHSSDLSLPNFFKTFPSFIVFLELTKPKSKAQIARNEAIRIACFMAETDPAYVGKYCNAEGSKFGALFKLFWRLALEAFLLPVRMIFSMLAKADR